MMAISSTSELKLSVGGFECPDAYVNDFTPMEFEDLVAMFSEFDKDKSGAVDKEELFVMMKRMDMEHSVSLAEEFMKEIDEDGSGELEFAEFVALVAMVKRGDKTTRGFAKLTQELKSTPAAVLAMEASKRNLRFRYYFVEKREATSMHDEFVVMEVSLTGHWFELVDGDLRESHGARKFQGIGKTTREARYKAAEAALTKMRATMPGLKYASGEIPCEWRKWFWRNVDSETDLESVLKTLRLKGFQPWQNVEFMQRVLLFDSYSLFLGRQRGGVERENKLEGANYYKKMADQFRRSVKPDPKRTKVLPQRAPLLFDGDDPLNKRKKWNGLSKTVQSWIDDRLNDGYDGTIILDTLAERSHPLDTLPKIAQDVRRNKGGLVVDVARPELVDFAVVCIRDWAREAKLYFDAGQDPDHLFETQNRTPLQLAAENGASQVARMLVDEYHADVELTDKLNRTPLHLAAMSGNTDLCKILVEAGADVHSVDTCFDTPLHCAARNNRADACDILATYEETFVRDVLAGLRRVGIDDNVFESCYDEFITRNLKATEMRHFEKAWIFDVALHCYDKIIEKRFVTKPVWTAVECVLRRMDPDPESGILAKAHIDDEVYETWVPTVSTPSHLVELLKRCFQYSALQTPNHLGRTALHEACSANKGNSHEETLKVLLEKHIGNVAAVDDHAKTPRDLILQPRYRADSPTGHPLREDIIEDRRADLLEDYKEAVRSIEEARSRERQENALADATRRGTDSLNWNLLRQMSRLTRSWNGIDEFEDPDTKNRFYRWRADDDELDDDTTVKTGDGMDVIERRLKSIDDVILAQNSALRYSWDIPDAFLFEEKVAQALEHIRRACRPLRIVGDWQILRDTRHKDECLLYASDVVASAGGIGISTRRPEALSWPKLHATAVSIGCLGVNDEWTIYQKDNNTFYYKETTNEYRWNRPVDAVERADGVVRCTNVTLSYKKYDQIWYTCNECTQKQTDKSIRVQICIHCAKTCHAGHAGVKYIRKSAIACSCNRLSCCQMTSSNDGEKDCLRFAEAETKENKRREKLISEFPALLAFLPDRSPDELEASLLNGWVLCRRLRGTQPVEGWHILVDPSQYTYLCPGTVVLVDTLDVVGAKIKAVVQAVRRKENGDNEYKIECENESGPREGVPRHELICVESRIFFWSTSHAFSSWTLPDDEIIMPIGIRQQLSAQLDKLKFDDEKYAVRKELPSVGDAIETEETNASLLDSVKRAMKAKKDQTARPPRIDEESAANNSRLETTSHVSESTTSADAIRTFNSTFRPQYAPGLSGRVRWPDLTGAEWEELVSKQCRLVRYLDDWEEYEHVRTRSRIWRDTVAAEEEIAARQVQRAFRQLTFRSAPRCWYSNAYQWEKPQEVGELEATRNGWALLRRRAKLLRSCIDRDARLWREYLDPISGEIFYFLVSSGFTQWEKPDLPDHKSEDKLGVFEQNDIVMYRFPGSPKDSLSIVARIRIDPDTHERMYDLKPLPADTQHDFKSLESVQTVKWVKRHNIRRRPLTHEEVEQQREEKLWRLQLRRVKEAGEREKARADNELQDSLFTRTRGGASKAENVALAGEDLERARRARAEDEATSLELETNAAIEQARTHALMANAEDEGIDIRALKAHQTAVLPTSIHMTEDELMEFTRGVEETKRKLQSKRTRREQEISQSERDEQLRQEWLAMQEDKCTTPRSMRRRRILRLLYNATERQNDGRVICEWGCGQWIKIGREKLFHEHESCVKRILPCALGCDIKMREEEWMAVDKTRGVTFQQWHEKHECDRRLVACGRKCGEWVPFVEMDHHFTNLCVKRPVPTLYCRLGCGASFGGGAHEFLQCDAARLEHELESCEERLVRCHVKGCTVTIKAKDRVRHRRLHILRANVSLFSVPGVYSYRVPPATRQLKVQLWGAGGGSGHLRDQVAGSGGGGAFVEALLLVVPGEYLQITVGAGGSAGEYGEVLKANDDDDSTEEIAAKIMEHYGVAVGGDPGGGGNGHGGNEVWAAGGGGGYSMIQRFTRAGPECVLVASGGGGGGSRSGVPGGGLNGELPGACVDKRNGRMGTQDCGGKAGDSGEASMCAFPAQAGQAWQGGAGAQFGGGGGGGVFGGGGGGMSPGIVGGGGGGSCFVDVSTVKDFVVLQGSGSRAGGGGHHPPKACGIGEWDFVGGLAGEGAPGDISQLNAGRNGAVRLVRPGFYKEDPAALQPTG